MSALGPYTVTQYRRHIAQQEARALRHLARAYGRLPVCAPTNWNWT